MSRTISILLIIIALGLAWFFFFQRSDIHNSIDSASKSTEKSLLFSNWHDFKAPSGKFHAKLPNLPQHAADTRVDEKSKESRDYEMFLTADDDGAAFSINTITFKDKAEQTLNDEFLEQTINEMLSNTSVGSVKSVKLVPYKNGKKAVIFSVENERGLLKGQAFLNGNTLYVLTSIHAQNNQKPETVDYFFDSFEINATTAEKLK